MKDILGLLNDLRRPRLLIRAARIGVQDYRRDPHLHRLLGYGALPRSGAAIMKLMKLRPISMIGGAVPTRAIRWRAMLNYWSR